MKFVWISKFDFIFWKKKNIKESTTHTIFDWECISGGYLGQISYQLIELENVSIIDYTKMAPFPMNIV